MRATPYLRISVCIVLLCACLGMSANAANIVSTTTGGNWNATTTWVGGVVPVSTDNVTIDDGATVTLTSTQTCATLTVGQGTTGTLQYYDGSTAVTLTVSGALTVNAGGIFQANPSPTVNGTHALSVAGSITNNGTIDLINTGSGFTSLVNTTTSAASGTQSITGTPTSTIFGGLTIGGASTSVSLGIDATVTTLTINSARTLTTGNVLTLNGNFTNNGTYTSTGTGEVLLSGGSASHTITSAAASNFGNLELDGTNGATFTNTSSTTTVSGNIVVTNGTLSIANFTTSFTVNGTTTIGSNGTLAITNTTGTKIFNGDFTNNGTFNNTTFAVTIGGNLTNNGTFTSGTGVYTFSGTGKTISGTLTITNMAVTGTVSNLGILTFNALTGTAGTFTNGSGFTDGTTSGVVNFTGTTIAYTGTLALSANTNTVNYVGAANQTVKNTSYYNLNIATGGPAITATAAGATTVTNNFTVTSGTFADGGFQITGNGTGQFKVLSGATYTTTKTATPWMPTAYPTANITLDPASTFNYNGTTAHSIVASPNGTATITSYGTLGIAGAVAKTLATNVSAANLTIAAGATFADGGFTATISGNVTNNGTHSGTGKIYLNGGSAQHVVASTATAVFGKLELDDAQGAIFSGTTTTISTGLVVTSGTFQISTFTGTLTLTGTTTIASGGTLSVIASGGTRTFNGDITVNPGGTFDNTTVNANVNIGGNITQNGTFNGGTGTYTFTVTGKTLNGSSASNIITLGSVSIATTLSITNNITLSVPVSLVGAGTLVNSTNATLNLGGTITITALTATATGNTVIYSSTAAAQTVKGQTYYNLTIDKSGQTATLGAATTVSNNLSILNGTLADGGLQITGNISGTFSMASGTNLLLGAAAGTAFPTSFTAAHISFASGSTVTYQGNAAQTISSVPTYQNLILQIYSGTAASTKTIATPSITYNGDLTVNNYAVLADGGFPMTGTSTGHFIVNSGGTYTTTRSTTPWFPTNVTAANIQLDNNSTVNYNANATFSIPTVPASYGNLGIAVGGVKTLATATTVNGNLAISAGTLADGGNTVTVLGNVTNAGAHTGTGKIYLNGGSAVHVLSGTGSYTNLELNDANGANMTSSFTINGTLTLTSGAYNMVGTIALTLNGPAISQTSGTLNTTTTSSLSFTGTGTGHFIPSSVTDLNILTLNNANGVTLNGSVNLNGTTGTLALTSGRLTLGANNLTLVQTAATITGTLSTANMVVADGGGQLKKAFATGATAFTFPIGDATATIDYSPVTLTFSANSLSRIIGVRVTDAQHPADVSTANYISRYWSFTDNQVGNGTYSYTASFTYSTLGPTDVNGSGYTLARYDGSNWFAINTTTAGANPLVISSSYNETNGTLDGSSFTGKITAQQTYTWVPTVAGSYDFNTPSNWSPYRGSPSSTDILQFTSGGTSTAINVPTQTIAKLVVDNNTDISLQAGAAAQILSINGASSSTNLDIKAGSTLELSSTGTNALTLNITTTASQVGNIAGNLILNSNTSNNNTFTTNTVATTVVTVASGGSITNNGGIVTASTATLVFANGSNYYHAMNGGVIPTATWGATSTATITGIINTTPTTFAGTFGNLVWNCTGQTTATGALTAASTIQGNLTISSGTLADGGFVITGNASGAFSVGAGGTFTTTRIATPWYPTTYTSLTLDPASTVNFNGAGSFTIPTTPFTTFGSLGIGGSGTKTLAADVLVQGSLNIAAGVLADGGKTVTVNGNVTNAGTHSGTGKIYMTGGTASHQVSGGGTFSNLELNDANGADMTGNAIIGTTGTLTLTNGTFNVNSYLLTLNGPAIGGTPTNLATTSGSSLSFGGTATGLTIPSSVAQLNALTLANANGLALNSSIQLNASGVGLTLTSGKLNLGNYDLTLSLTTTISGTFSVSNMVVADATGGNTGQLKKTFAAGATAIFTFPIGDITSSVDYSPVAITMTANSTQRTIGVKVTDAQNANDVSTNNYISRYWTFSDDQAGTGTYTYTGTFTYSIVSPTDLVGTQTLISVNRWNGTQWSQLTSTYPTNGFTITGATQTTGTLGGNDFTGRINAQQTYTWVPTSGSNDFTDPTNWTPQRYSPLSTDILQFTSGGSSSAYNVATQTVAQVLVDNNTDISLQASTTNQILSINGTTLTNTLDIRSGSNLELSGTGTNYLTLNFVTTASQHGNIAGTLTLNSNTSNNNNFTTSTVSTTVVTVASGGNIINNGGTITATAATLVFASGSNYYHAMNGGAIPAVTWQTGSTCNVTGLTTTNCTGFSGVTFSNLVWNNTGQTTATGAINGAMTVNGNLSVLAGTMYDAGLVITGNATGTFLVDNGATYTTAKTATSWFPTNFTTITLNPTSTFNYTGAASFTLPTTPTTTYGNLGIAGGTSTTTYIKTIGANTLVQGNLTIPLYNTLADGGKIVTVNGGIANTSTTGHTGTGKIYLNGGSGIHTLTGTGPYANMELDDANGATTSGNTTITGALTLTNGSFGIASGTTLTINGVLSATSGTFTGSTTSNLTLASTGTSATIPAIINGLQNLSLSRTAASTTTLAASVALAGNLTLSSSSNTLADGGNTLTVGGNIVNANGVHTGAGKISIANGTANHTISNTTTGTQTFGNLEINDPNYSTTFSNAAATTAITNVASLTVTSGTLNIANFTSSMNISGATYIGSNGTLAITNTTGTKTFTGDFTNDGTFTNTTFPVTMAGNVTNNGTFNGGTATYTLSGASKTIGGSSPLTLGTAAVTGSYTNTGILNIQTALSGAGSYTNGNASTDGVTSGILNYSSATAIGVTTFTANTFPNTVVYNNSAGAQSVRATSYYNLNIALGGAYTATAAGAITVGNNFNVLSGTFADNNQVITGNTTGGFLVDNGATYTSTRTATSWFPTNYTSITLNPASTFNYNGAASFTIPSTPTTTYGSLGFGGGAFIKTLPTNILAQGNLTITNGTVADGGNTLTVYGNVTNGGAHTGVGKIYLNGGSSVHTLSGTGSYTNLELNDANGAAMGANFTINGTLTLTSGSYSVGSNTLTLNGPAIAGSGANTNLITTTGSSLSFTGTGTGHFVPASVSDLNILTLNNANGLSLNSSVNLNGTTGALTLTAGVLTLGAYDLALVNTAGTITVTTPSVTKMVLADGAGQLKKTFAAGANALFTFPIGDATGSTDYSPVALTFTANSTQRTIGVRVTDAQNPNDASTSNYISRYWSFTDDQAGTGTYTYTGTFTYSTVSPTDLNGTQTATTLNRWDGSSWTGLPTTYPTNGFTVTGATQTSGTLGGNDFTGKVAGPTTYVWNATTGTADWTDPASWTPDRISPLATDILQFTNGGSSVATNVPTQTVASILVDNNTDISLQPTATNQILSINGTTLTNTLDIRSGSTMELSGAGSNYITLNFTTTASQRANIAGTLVLNSNTSGNNTFTTNTVTTTIVTVASGGAITNNGGTITSTAATLVFADGSTYNHARDGGAIPTVAWGNASNCNITGIVSTNPSPFTGTFGNLTWNCAGQTTATGSISTTTVVNDTLYLLNGTMAFNGLSLTLNGNVSSTSGLLSGNTSSTLVIGGTSGGELGTINFATGGQAINVFTVNRTGTTPSLTLGTPLTATSLNLTSGVVNMGANVLTVAGTATTSITNTGGANSYVNGQLARTMPTNYSTASTWAFPVGASAYQLFDITNPVTGSTGTAIITVQAVDANAGGTAGVGFSTLNTNRYWNASVSGTGSLTSLASIDLTETGTSGSNAIGQAATLTGNYHFKGGTYSSPKLISTGGIDPALGYFVIGTKGANLCGTYTIGPSGDFASIADAAAVLNTATLTCNTVFELQSNYTSASESFPIAFTPFTTSGGSWTATFRPAAGVTSTLVTVGDPGSAQPLFNFNGVDNLIFDGVPGGSTGSNTVSNSKWTIRNSRTAATVGPTFQFTSDASSNTLKYLQIEGQNIQTGSGTIIFTSTAASTGNDNNTISFCSIRDRSDAAGIPFNAVYSVGSATYSNDNNTISNNDIFNFWNGAGLSTGINVGNYNNSWTISGNNFFQTVTRTPANTAAVSQYPIYVNSTNTSGFSIIGNYIGGGDEQIGGTAWTVSAAASYTTTFVGIYVNNSTSSTSTIQNNTIGNMAWSCSNTSAVVPGIFTGIYTVNGAHNIDGNTIGATTGTGSITITSGTAGGNSYGIGNTSSNGAISITNNNVGSITVQGTSTAISHNFTGIYYAQGLSSSGRTVSGNLVGSHTTANSINAATTSTSATAQSIYGIYMSGGANAVTLDGNTVANLNNNYTGTGAGVLVGIYSPFATNTITDDTVKNLTSNSAYTGTGASASVIGILVNATSANGHTISHNVVHSLANNNGSATVSVNGIYYAPSTGGTNTIDGNFIHSLTASSANATVNGLYINTGSGKFTNNMVRLGINPDSSSSSVGYTINGIYEAAGTNNIYFNSVYVGGSGVSSAYHSYAMQSAVSSGTRAIENNIFFNARSNSSTGKNYGLKIAATTGLTCDYNDVYANGTNGYVGANGANDYSTLSAWRSGTGLGGNSISGNPNFIDATGSYATLNLHIDSTRPTPIADVAVNVGVTNDIDGDTRATGTPPSGADMGADEGNFPPADNTPPTITYTVIPDNNSCSGQSYTLSGVTITDGSGVDVASGTKPRLYFKKSGDANTYLGNTAATDGWKYVEASNSSSPFSFTLDYSQLHAGSVAAGDQIQYFVVAQDLASPTNVAINSGTFNATPLTLNLASANFPIGGSINSFSILPCQGTITVGTGGNYGAFTTATGLFQAINRTTLTGNLTVNVISDITIEDGTNALNQWAESGVGNYTLTIQSDGSAHDINSSTVGGYAGTSTNIGLFRMNGADRVTFNGGTGAQRLLTFRNNYASAGSYNATFSFTADAQNDQINNCILEGGNSGASCGVIYFGAATTTGNKYITIDRCDVRDLTSSTAYPVNDIYAIGTSGKENSNISITNSRIYNHNATSGVTAGINLGNYNNSYTITGDSIYQAVTRTPATATNFYGIYSTYASTAGGHNISNNYIGGNGSSGTYTVTGTTVANTFTGIYLNTGAGTSHTVNGNIIKNINFSTSGVTRAAPGIWCGIQVLGAGSATIGTSGNGNTIGVTSGVDSVYVTTSGITGGTSYGIVNAATGTVNINYNNIAGVTTNGSAATATHGFTAISSSAGTNTVTYNTIGNSSVSQSIRALCATTVNNTSYSQTLTGIVVSSSGTNNINNNTISNLYDNASTSTTTGQVLGIVTTTGINTISNNTISNLTNNALNTAGTGTAASVIGISQQGTTGSEAVTQNTIYGLSNTATGTATVNVTGIYYTATSAGTNNLVNRNNIHSFSTAATNAVQWGITTTTASGTTAIQNNMVRLGIDATGSAVTPSTYIAGIYKQGGNANVYFNSVYIGGTGVASGSNNTFAYVRTTAGTDDIRNNIFDNERANASGSALHYAAATNTNVVTTMDYNIYRSTSGNVFSINGGTTPLSTLQAVEVATSTVQNTHSGIGDPNFINPTGNAANVNLHLNSNTPAEQAGIAIASVTTDIDGDSRASNTPTDLGADAANFTYPLNSDRDIYPPIITYTPLGNQGACTTSSVSLTATITDIGTGVPTSGTYVPRIYYRRSSPSATAWASAAGTLQTGDGNNGTWLFNIDYTTLGVTPTGSDVYQYYVVAEDQAANTVYPNIGFSKYDASTPVFTNNDVNSQVTAPTSPDSYSIVPTLSGTVYVGTGAGTPQYATYSALFAAINSSILDGNLTVIVQNSTTEPASATVLNAPTYCSGTDTIFIIPASATVYTATGTTSNPAVIGFNGASNVIIDGSYSGAGQYIKFLNNSPSSNSVVLFQNNANHITVKNCVISGTTNSSGANVKFSTSASAGDGNSYITISGCNIGHASYASSVITSTGTAGRVNHDNTITGNNIFNFIDGSGGTGYGINITGTGNGSNWTISNNSIYSSGTDGTGPQVALNFAPGSSSDGNTMSGNYIGGQSAQCGGSALTNNTGNDLQMIYLNVGTNTSSPTVVSNNTIQNIYQSYGTYGGVTAIYVNGGTANIDNNLIGHPTNYNNILSAGGGVLATVNTGWVYGIYSLTTSQLNVTNNTIAGLTAGGGYYSYGTSIEHDGNGPINITGNTIANSGNAGNDNTYPLNYIGVYVSSNATGIVIDQNTITNLGNASSLVVNGNNVDGIIVTGSGNGGTISNNKLSNFFHYTNGGFSVGLALQGTGAWNVYNNMIDMYNKSGSTVYTTRKEVYGILDYLSGGSANFYYNTVLIHGSQTGTSGVNYPSECFYKLPGGTGSGNGDVTVVKNNLLMNARTGNPTANSKHYCIDNTSTTPSTNWTSDYNFLSTANNSTLGYWTADRTFAAWQSNSGGDSHSTWAQALTSGTNNSTSTSANPYDLFIDPANGDLHIKLTSSATYQPYQFVLDLATTLSGYATDIDGQSRPLDAGPDMGADEFESVPAPTLTATANGNATTDAECTSATVALAANPVGPTPNNCGGNWQYAWYNGTSYWNGSSFGSGTAIYDVSYTNITVTGVTSTTTYTALVNCSSNTAITSNSSVVVNILGAPATVSAAIGSPANGLNHHMTVSWAAVTGATGYDVDYSSDGSSWTNIASNIAATTYDHGTGDNPNAPCYYRVRARNSSTGCTYATMSTPVYTACDIPAIPTVSNATSNTIDIAIAAESPVQNPAITTYSIYCVTTGQFVQANGSLGSTEVFQTAATWATTTVTGLTVNTQYCFYARAQNHDGDIRDGGTSLLTPQAFTTNVLTTGTASTSNWWSPASCTTGGMVYSASGGCTGGNVGFTGSFNNYYGCFLRTPAVNCTGQSTVTMTFDLSNSYFAAHPLDNISFNMWAPTASSPGGTYINAASVNGVSGYQLAFNQTRTCSQVTVVFDLSTVTNSSAILFYLNPSCGYNDANVFSVKLDNIGFTAPPSSTSCITTVSCTAPTLSAQGNGTTTSTTVCSGVNVALTANPSGGSGCTSFFEYSWSDGTHYWNGTDFTGVSPVFDASYSSITATPSASVTFTVTGRCNTNPSCTSNSNVAVTVNSLPTAVTVSGGGTYCGSATLVASGGTGGTIYWQNSTSAGTSTTTPSSNETVTSSGTYYFRAQSAAGCWGPEGSASDTINPGPNPSTTWTGSLNNDWFDYHNWTNCVPGKITVVTIPVVGTGHYPSVFAGNPTSYSISVASGASLTLPNSITLDDSTDISNSGTITVTDSATISLGGNWTNTGTFVAGSGTVVFVDTATSTIAPGSSNFNNLTVDKVGTAKVTMTSDVTANNLLKVNKGVLELPTGKTATAPKIRNETNGTINILSNGKLKTP